MSSLPSQNAIRQSKYISTKSTSIRKVTVDGRDMGPLFLTHNALVPFGNPLVFTDYHSVCLHFGSDAEEAKVAKIYFDYTESHTTKQTQISFARYESDITDSNGNVSVSTSSVVSSLVLKEDTYKSYTTSFWLGHILDSSAGEAGVKELYQSYVSNGTVGQNVGEVIGYRSPYLQGFNTYFAIVQTNDTKPRSEARTITLVYGGEVASYDELPTDKASVGSFYAIYVGVGSDGSAIYDRYVWWYDRLWRKLDGDLKEGSVVEVLDASGNAIFDVIHPTPTYELVPLYRLNRAKDLGTVDTLEDINDTESSFGDSYRVKSRDNTPYTYDGYRWYMRAITDTKKMKIRTFRIVGTNTVSDISTFYKENSNVGSKYLVASIKKIGIISCNNRGEVTVTNKGVTALDADDVPSMSEGDMYFVTSIRNDVVSDTAYVVRTNGKWQRLEYYVKDYDQPITSEADMEDSTPGDDSSASTDDDVVVDVGYETGIGYYLVSPTSIKIPLIFTIPMETYEDVAEKLQDTIRLYSEFESVSVAWVVDGTNGDGTVSGHFEVSSDDLIGLEGFTYRDSNSLNLSPNFGFVGSTLEVDGEYDYETKIEAIQRLVLDYNNFGSFAFIDDADPLEEIANWNVAENYKYLYSTSSSVDYIPSFSVVGTAVTLRGSSLSGVETPSSRSHEEVIPMAIFAATYYEISDSIKNFMFQTPEGFTPSVYSDSDKKRFDALNVNYVGRTQEHGRTRDYFQTGVCLDGSLLSVYCAEVWLQDRFSVTLLNLMLENEKLSPTTDSLVIVSSRMTVQIQAALANGMIQSTPTLANPTRVYVDQIAGADNAWQEVEKDGYALVLDFADNLAVGGGKCITYKFIYSKMGVRRFSSGTHAYREF